MSDNEQHNIDQILDDWLDGDAENESARTGESTSRAVSERAVEALMIHGLLRDLGRRDETHEAEQIVAVMRTIEGVQRDVPQPACNVPVRRIALVSAAAGLAACLLLMLFLQSSNPVNAATESLERIIAVAEKPLDRSYIIRVVDEYPKDRRPRNLPVEAWQRERKKQIDGATLYVRGANKYVLIRKLKDGRMRITGCDGKESWALREDGPVHVSADLSRFRGGLPGHQQDFPFINIQSHLEQLRAGYDLDLAAEPETWKGQTLSGLVGTRKSRSVRGPKGVEIWFDAESGTIHKMLLDGLPRGGGGPESVMLELTDQSDLGAAFFSHESHHELNRRIKYEESRS